MLAIDAELRITVNGCRLPARAFAALLKSRNDEIFRVCDFRGSHAVVESASMDDRRIFMFLTYQ
jgi:hypothetical protein